MLALKVARYVLSRLSKSPVEIKKLKEHGDAHGRRLVEPSVSIIIPTRDKAELLRACVDSILEKTSYLNFEIVVVNNNSVEAATLKYLERLQSQSINVLDFPFEFNYSKISNFAVAQTTSDYLCFLNNDTLVLESDWLSNLVDHAVQPSTGVVGSKLLFPDGRIQHLGVALGYKGIAGHIFSGFDQNHAPITSLIDSCFEVTAVTFACSVVSRAIYKDAGGLDVNYKIGLNDVDFCNRVALSGFQNILCGSSSLIHYETMSRPKAFSMRGAGRASYEILYALKHFPKSVDSFFSTKKSSK